MNCEEFVKIAYSLAAGELDQNTAREAMAHRESCPSCKSEYEKCRLIAESLKSLGEVQAPSDLIDNVMKEVSRRKSRKRANIIRFGSAAAAALVILAGTAVLNPVINRDNSEVSVDESVPETSAGDVKYTAADEYEAEAENEPLRDEESAAAAVASLTDRGEETDLGLPHAENSVENSANAKEKTADTQTAAGEAQKARHDEASPPVSGSSGGSGGSGGGEMALGGGPVAEPRMKTSGAYFDAEEGVFARSEENSGDEAAASGGAAFGEREEKIPSEEKYIKKIAEFVVPEEYAKAAALAETDGCAAADVERQLKILGAEYTLNVTEIDYTAEYMAASPERREEIREICQTETCTITVENQE